MWFFHGWTQWKSEKRIFQTFKMAHKYGVWKLIHAFLGHCFLYRSLLVKFSCAFPPTLPIILLLVVAWSNHSYFCPSPDDFGCGSLFYSVVVTRLVWLLFHSVHDITAFLLVACCSGIWFQHSVGSLLAACHLACWMLLLQGERCIVTGLW